eukprot:PITA_27734
MEHTGRGGISRICADSSFGINDSNTLAFMDQNGLLFCADLMQGNCDAGSLVPISPSSHAVELEGWSLDTSDSLWASHDLPVNPAHSFQPPLVHEVSEPLRRNGTQNFTQNHPSFQQNNLYGDSAPQGRVDRKEPNCGYSSDEMDDLKEEVDENSQPKALVSERKRRSQLNEKLYALRSLVPKITKMDKASIVADTITHLQDLQKEVNDLQAEIEGLRLNISRPDDSTPLYTANAVHSDMDHEMQSCEVENCNNSNQPLALPGLNLYVTKVQDTFHLRIYCQKKPGVLVKLIGALESIQLDFHNTHLTCLDGHIIKTATVKINKPHGPLEAGALKRAILEATTKYGFGTI